MSEVFRDNYMTAKKYSALVGKPVEAVYCMKHLDLKKNRRLKKYKRVGSRLYIDATEELQTIETQKEFERLYYILIDRFESEYQLAKEVGKKMGKRVQTVSSYLTGSFGMVRCRRSLIKEKYVQVFKEMVDA